MSTKFDDGKDPLFYLLELDYLAEVAKARAYGCKKYGESNIYEGEPLSRERWISASLRHLKAYIKGEEIDKDSGEARCEHLAMAAINIILYADQEKRRKARELKELEENKPLERN